MRLEKARPQELFHRYDYGANQVCQPAEPGNDDGKDTDDHRINVEVFADSAAYARDDFILSGSA